MKKFVVLILTFMLILPLVGLADEEAVIRVKGQGSINLTADRVTVEIGTRSKSASIAEAHAENIKTMNAIMESIQKVGVEKEKMMTRQYTVDTYEEGYNSLGVGTTTVYAVTNMLFVKVDDLSLLSQVLDAATKAGANNIWGLNFYSTQSKEAYQQALEIAVQNARVTAETLAKASGKKLGEMKEVLEFDHHNSAYGVMVNMEMEKGAGGTPISAADVTVTANLEITFELE